MNTKSFEGATGIFLSPTPPPIHPSIRKEERGGGIEREEDMQINRRGEGRGTNTLVIMFIRERRDKGEGGDVDDGGKRK
jgi:hypothetical protein